MLPVLGVVVAIASVAAPTGSANANSAMPSTYSFKAIAFLGDPAGDGGTFTFDFEPTAVNSVGTVAFTADLTSSPTSGNVGEGVFLGRSGQIFELARVGEASPPAGTFGPGELGRIGLNTVGDASFAFTLVPFDPNAPLGLNAGVYRFSHNSQRLSALLVPGQSAPGGGTFEGTYFHTGINARGSAVFSGIVTGGDINPGSPPGYQGMGTGLFLSPSTGGVVTVARPGTAAPGGGVFDSAINGSINNAGDIAFGGHVAGEECVNIGSPLVCGESVYIRNAQDGAFESVAHQASSSPCGGAPYRTAFGPLINSSGDIVFVGDLTPPPASGNVSGVFLFSDGQTSAVACPGDSMPGGGNMVSAGNQDGTYSLNDKGQVTFAAVLNTTNQSGVNDTGIYSSRDGATSLVARTGTVIPGVGTIASIGLFPGPPTTQTGGILNSGGQVLLSAALTNGGVVLLLATPEE
jgi:hypothetical protein